MADLDGSDSGGLIDIDIDIDIDQTDLNTPATGDGILGWMGVAHILSSTWLRTYPGIAGAPLTDPMRAPIPS